MDNLEYLKVYSRIKHANIGHNLILNEIKHIKYFISLWKYKLFNIPYPNTETTDLHEIIS